MRLIEPPPAQYRKIDGHARDQMTSQGLDGGRHLGRLEGGRGLPSTAPLPPPGHPVNDRYSFQGAQEPTSRKFSPAPQLTTAIGAPDKQSSALDLAWD